MRWLVLVAITGCRSGRPVEYVWTPVQAWSDSDENSPTRYAGYGVTVPLETKTEVVVDGDAGRGIFSLAPAWLSPTTIPGRYMIDGVYVQSRAPCSPVWRW